VTVRLTLNDRVVDLVDEGYDCVFRVGALADSTLMARCLRPVELVACASPAYLAQRGVPRHPCDLAGHECLGFADWELEQCWRFAGPEGEIAVPIRVSVRAAPVLHEKTEGHRVLAGQRRRVGSAGTYFLAGRCSVLSSRSSA
jgi:DNA-binding transcriptional LysR family regulator